MANPPEELISIKDFSFGLTFFAANLCLFRPFEIDKVGSKDGCLMKGNYTIYLIAKRKKIFFEKCCMQTKETYISTFYTFDQKNNKVYFSVPHTANLKILKQDFGCLEITQDNSFCRVSDYVFFHRFWRPKYRITEVSNKIFPTDLEVIYVGQSQRRIKGRLMQHVTLQKILAEVNCSGTSEDVMIIAIAVCQRDFTALNVVKQKSKFEDIKKIDREYTDIASRRVTHAQMTTLYEAALIKYFQPEFNTEYKRGFPSKKHTSYNEISNTEFNRMAFELDTRELGVQLYSKIVLSRSCYHWSAYDLPELHEIRSVSGF